MKYVMTDPLYFFDNSQTGKLARSIDWKSHALGPAENWPVSLKTTLSILFRNRHPMFLFWGKDLTCFYNDAYLPSFGIGKHPTAMGQTGFECWPEIWSIIGPQIEQVMSGGEGTWNIDHLVPIFRNGKIEEVYWTYSYSAVLAENGTPAGVVVTCTETTNSVINQKLLKASEESARRTEQELNSLFKLAPFPLALLEGPDHKFKFANLLYEKFFLAGKEYVGKPVVEVLPEAKSQGFIMLLNEVYQKGERYIGREISFEVINAEGKKQDYFLNFVYEPVRNALGEMTGILAAISDVTDLVNSKNQLEDTISKLVLSQDLRDKFVAALSHDLRTPLTAAKITAQMIIRKAGDPLMLHKLTERIIRSMERADDMIRDLLDANRIKAGESVHIEIQKCNLSDIVRETLTDLASIHGDRFIIEASEAVVGKWDCSAIRRVIENLVNNAIKYGSDTGSISINLKHDVESAELNVHNVGNTIPPDQLKTIFEPYQRSPSANISAHKGWGIGLTLVKGFVEAHGGKVSVTSTANEGTNFKVTLPKTII